MDIVRISPKKPEESVIKQAVEVIRKGGVVAFPTDTAYGLAVNAVDEKAIGKLFIMKQRMQKALPVLVDSITMLNRMAVVTKLERELIKKYWPGALTIIFKKKEYVPLFLTLGMQTIGVRMPDYAVATAFVKKCGTPLTSTSANISGQGNCYNAECVTRMFQASDSQPDLILDAGDLPEVPVSTVVQFEEGKLKVLRPGPVVIKK